MEIVVIAAVSKNNVIGKDGEIPWHVSQDLRQFKQVTMKHALIMGRKTYESLGGPLPGRLNVVLTSSEMAHENVVFCTSLIGSLDYCREQGHSKAFVIGGRRVYEEAFVLDVVDKLLLTRVHACFDGDTFFPEVSGEMWELKETNPFTDSRSSLSGEFQVFVRKGR